MKRVFNTKSFSAALGFIAIVLVWIFFAPVQIGGQAFYVIINGNSMEPNFHWGDLVVLKTSPFTPLATGSPTNIHS
jgi:signal peptidase I